ncbi:putative phosphonate uptake related protein [unidentified eubacterium SCB49]|nr:putative phosphonate uptake related protein [unidentified eubacterium SCB49]
MTEDTFTFAIIPASEILTIVPLLEELGSANISEATRKERVLEMASQNYECVGLYDGDKLIGACGMWFMTRHYAGKSVEVDHVIITAGYQGKGLGKKMMEWVYVYAQNKGCLWVELNTFVHNFPSHKFYYNEGFVSKGYHMVKEF